jgi:hypothetical protein
MNRAEASKPKDMLEAITQGLAKTAPKVDLEEEEGKESRRCRGREAAEKHANGAPKKDAAGNELDDKGSHHEEGGGAQGEDGRRARPQARREEGARPEGAGPLQRGDHDPQGEGGRGRHAHREDEAARGSAQSIIAGILRGDPHHERAALGVPRIQHAGAVAEREADLQNALEIVESQRAALYVALGKRAGRRRHRPAQGISRPRRRSRRRRSRARTRWRSRRDAATRPLRDEQAQRAASSSRRRSRSSKRGTTH